MTRPIFEEPPEDMALRSGAILVNWNDNAGVAAPEVSSAFRVAAERLLDAALANNETWEAAYPILFCYRHGLEISLKSLVPGAPQKHGLGELWAALLPRLAGQYPAGQLAWLSDRIAEFEHVDPRSTAFRYADAVPAGRAPELWVDFHHLKTSAALLFDALDRLRLVGSAGAAAA
ncbi:hypothetical protein [Rhodovarius lipocyclicus]|uniref:hypothetical protein n=1 Tax=Rhodovarius lipocyclicus TaxID=268410 RepID=UPI0013579644|nr:hypothetical protein [Rhodovarius lipocyclicus]